MAIAATSRRHADRCRSRLGAAAAARRHLGRLVLLRPHRGRRNAAAGAGAVPRRHRRDRAAYLSRLCAARRSASPCPMPASFFLLALLNNVIPFSLIFAGQTAAGRRPRLGAQRDDAVLDADHRQRGDRGRKTVAGTRWPASLLGIAGTAVMVGPGLLAGLGGPVWAKFALIGASLSYAFALIFARRFKGVPPPIVATGQLTASTIIMIPVVLIVLRSGRPVRGQRRRSGRRCWRWRCCPPPSPTSSISASSRSAGATNASLVTLVVPVSAILLGFAVPRRTAGAVRDRRHGADRAWPGDHRRAAVWPTLGMPRVTRTSVTDSPQFFPQLLPSRDLPIVISIDLSGMWQVAIFHNPVALQHIFRLPVAQMPLDSAHSS